MMVSPAATTRRTRILYLHHGGGMDGSLVSLRELVRFLDRRRFDPVVALLRPGDEVRRALEDVGARTVSAPGIVGFNHATAFWSDARKPRTWPPLVETALGWRRALRETLRVVESVQPDLVHVNSVVLAPSADALRRARVPFVWHVREMPVPGRPGVRGRLQRHALLEWPDDLIFLSEHARHAWVGGARGVVVPELVDPVRFDPSLDRASARRALGLPGDAPIVLFLGGMAELKGIVPLLQAIPHVAAEVPGAVFAMPGTQAAAPGGTLPAIARVARALGARTAAERVEAAFRDSGAAPFCLRMPFSEEVPRLLAACDVLVFPALEDHFARPVVEAAFVGRPVVASRLPLIEEAVRDGESAVLGPANDAPALARAIAALLRDPARRAAIGAAAREAALARFDARANAALIEAVYGRLAKA